MVRWNQQPVSIIVIVVGQVIPVYMYVKLFIADKELSGIVEHHDFSKFTPVSAATNSWQPDSNVVAAVFGDEPGSGLSGSVAGATSKASIAAAAPQLGPNKPDTATRVK